jgi:hypothetical protein
MREPKLINTFLLYQERFLTIGLNLSCNETSFLIFKDKDFVHAAQTIEAVYNFLVSVEKLSEKYDFIPS